jgi:hypothetical protein
VVIATLGVASMGLVAVLYRPLVATVVDEEGLTAGLAAVTIASRCASSASSSSRL